GHRLRFWDARTGKEFHEDPAAFGYEPVLAVSSNGHLLAAGDWMEQSVRLWNATTGRLVHRLPLIEDDKRYIRDLGFAADGRTLIACQHEGWLHLWDLATGKTLRTVRLLDPNRPDKDHVYFFRFHASPDTKRLATLERMSGAAETTRLASWDTTTGKL